MTIDQQLCIANAELRKQLTGYGSPGTIQELRDVWMVRALAWPEGTSGRKHGLEYAAQLTRVLALCKAADAFSGCCCGEPKAATGLPPQSVVYMTAEKMDDVLLALAEMRKHGDIPADGMTREGPI